MTDEQRVFDFEGVLSTAIQAVFNELDTTAFSIQDEPSFDKGTPRVEVWIEVGNATGQVYNHGSGYAVAGNDKRSESQFEATCTLRVITAPDADVHSAYRACIRNVSRTMCNRVNEVKLPLHSLDMFSATGASIISKAEKGFYESVMTYNLKFSIQANAWALVPHE